MQATYDPGRARKEIDPLPCGACWQSKVTLPYIDIRIKKPHKRLLLGGSTL